MTNLNPVEFKFRLIVGVICVILFLVIATFSTFEANEKSSEFPDFDDHKSIRGRVTNVEKERSWIRVTLDDSIKRTIYSPTNLVDFVRSGDFLERRVDNDTICVTRDNKTYSFR